MSTSGETANNSNNMNTDFKRKRNFTEEEKNFLVELVEQYQQIITSKDNKSSMKIQKDRVWSEIHQKFNRSINREMNSTRTLDQLKKCWENLRTKAKREYKQLNIGNSLEENNLQHRIIGIIGDELDHTQNQQQFEFGDSFAIDYENDFNIIGTLNQNLHDTQQLQVQTTNKPQMRQILVNKLISKQQQLQQDDMNDEINENENLVDDFRIQASKKNPIIGKQQLIVEGKLVNNPEDVVVENENDLGDELNGDELLDEDEDLMDEIDEEMGYEDDLQYDDEDGDLEDDVDEIVYEEDGMLTSVVRNKSCNNNIAGQNSKQSNNTSPFINGNVKRLKSNNNSTIEDGHSSSNHSNSLNNFKQYSPQQNNKKFSTQLAFNNARNYSNGLIVNKSMFNKNLNNKLINNNLSNSNLNEALSDLKLKEQRTRLRMARLELMANRRRAQLELELAMAKLENERRKKQLLERQLENEQLTHRIYRKKIDKQT